MAVTRSVRELAPSERPRERMQMYGAGALSNAELLAVILNTGTEGEPVLQLAERLLREHDGFPGLMGMEVGEIAKVRGLGPAKAATLKAVMEIARRVLAINPDQRPRITAPEDVFTLVGLEMALLEQEQLRVVLLNVKHEVLGIRMVYQGSVNQAQVRMAELFRDAVRSQASGIILVHNHPSGDPTPSKADEALTRDAVEAGKLLDIDLVDHLIVGRGRNASLRRLGVGF
jgi:DNA repair protein RadC